MGGDWSDEYCHHARSIHIYVVERFHQHEPDRDDDLHADGNELRWLENFYPDRYREHADEARDQLVHRQSYVDHFRFQQHSELGDDWGKQYCHHARIVHVQLCERFHEGEPDSNDKLHADGNEFRWLDYGYGKGHSISVWWPVDDHNYFLPRRNPRRSLCRLHYRWQRRNSAVHVLRERERQLFSVA